MLYQLNTVDITLKTLSTKHQKLNDIQETMASISMNSTNFDQTMSLYIPRVDTRSLPRGNRHAEAEYEAMAADFIGKQFKYQRIGQVSRVDLLKKQTPQGFDYFIAFVHFTKWFDTPQARALQEDIFTEGTKAKLQFHKQWYWIVNENKSPLSANEASLHKTIYEQAKQIGMLNEAVDYLKSMKSVPPSVAEAALAETAQRGFGSTQNAMMTPPPRLTRQQTTMAPQTTWNSPTDFPPIWANGEAWVPAQDGSLHLLPSPLQRSAAEQLPDITAPADPQFQTPPRNRPEPLESPPALIRQRTVRFRDDEAKTTSRNLFGSSIPESLSDEHAEQ